ncbi:MAG: hypothetical protein ABSH47_27625 [Bryobacteraceae bacterium]
MSFYRKYELERLVQKAEPKTFRAREVAGGRPVYLHLLAGMDAVSRKILLQRVRGLATAGNPAVIEVDDNEFAPYVVTGVLEDFEGLPAWLDRLSLTPSPPPTSLSPDALDTQTIALPGARPQAPEPPPVEPAQPAGEFTARFAPRSAAPGRKPPAPAPRAPRPAPAASPAAVSPPVAAPGPAPAIEAGEFTRMFAASGGQPPPPAQPPPAAPGGSEFSRLFGAGPASQPPPPPGGEEPGEFSRLFGAPPAAPADNPAGFAPPPAVKRRPPEAPLPWEPQPPAPAQPIVPLQPKVPPRPVVETPDTQKMQAYAPPHPAPAKPPAAAPPPALEESASMWNSAFPPSPPQRHPDKTGPGEFTRFFASPLASSSLPIEEIEQGRMPEAQAPANRPFAGPGEFTRWFGSAKGGDSTPPPAPPAQRPTFSGAATGLFATPQQPGAQATSAPAEQAGPSEYTKMLAAQQAPAAAEPAAYVPGAKPGRGPLIAIIIVIAVVMVLLVVTVVFTMRH